MSQHSNNVQTNDFSPRGLGKMLVPCVVAFFGVLFFLLQSPHPASAHSTSQVIKKDVGSTAAVNFNFHYSQPAHLPFESFPLPAEVEVTDESETDDDSHEEASAVWHDEFVETTNPYVAEGPSFSQLALSFANRSTVCLFVLHHSWRSFPC